MLLRKRCDGEKAGNQRNNKKAASAGADAAYYADVGFVLIVILGIIVIRVVPGDIDHCLMRLRSDRVRDREELIVL